MNVSAPFVHRPVMTSLLWLGTLIFGWMAYHRLPVSDLPNVDFPTIQVSGSLPGASPETIAATVATPLEKQFATIAGVTSMTSSSQTGRTQITLQFDLARSLDAAAQDVQAAISAASSRLPRDMPSPPTLRKVNPADDPILFIAVTTPTLPLSDLNEYGETFIAQRLSAVPGVAQVLVYGSQKYAVRVQVDPRRLAASEIGIDEVAAAIQRANVNLPVGQLQGSERSYNLRTNGQLARAESYRPLIVAYRGGNPVRLDSIADVFDSVENTRSAAWFNDERSITLAVQKQPGTNTVQIVDDIYKLLPSIQAQLPASVSLHIQFDRSQSIRESVHDVQFTLILTVALVIMVIFLFLRSITATLIPSVAIPASIVATFGLMHLWGFSLDNLSLMALTLCVGFVVDDAIVVLENIVRHLEAGKPRLQAVLDGTREIAFTVVSMTISLAAVFIPMLFMGGLVGRLLFEFAVTIAVAILISGVVSLTLTPMLAQRLLRSQHAAKRGWLYRASEAAFDRMQALYGVTLRWALRGHVLVALGSIALTYWTYVLFRDIPKGFLPSEDTGRIQIQTEAIEGISFAAMVEHQLAARRLLEGDPDILSINTSIGSGPGSATNAGRLFVRLKPRSERTKSVDQKIQEFRVKLAALPGLRVFPQNPPPIRIGGNVSRSQYQFTLQSADVALLTEHAPRMAEVMRSLPGIQDISTNLQVRTPEVRVSIDRDKAATIGVNAEQIELALGSAFGDREISTIYASNNDYPVILEVAPQFQADPSTLRLLHVRGAAGRLTPLDSVARFERGVGVLSVNHLGQLPSVTISFNLAPDQSLGPAVAAIEEAARRTLPDGVTGSFEGAAQAFQDSLNSLPLLLLVSVLVIYLVLGVLYESFIHPLTILTALPFAGLGALWTLDFFGSDLNLYAFVGVILLVGLVKKNGIMMIDFAIDARRAGATARDAIEQACLVRFRPIMMTTVAALVGTLPIALGYGAGAEARQPLGLAVVGGLLFSQSLTLYATPVFYVYMEWLSARFARRSAATAEQPATTLAPA